jgi:DNA polymerase-3 subunit alpha
LTIAEALESVPEFKEAYESGTYLKELIETARDMEGVVRNAGTHAAGVIIADQPIVNMVPLHRPTSGAEDSPVKVVTPSLIWEFWMPSGFYKVDFSRLATLTIMSRGNRIDLPAAQNPPRLDLHNIPTDDPEPLSSLATDIPPAPFSWKAMG